jgi:PhnB protein
MTMQAVTPYLTVKGAAQALAFYQKAFGASDIFTHAADDGKRLLHARMTINGGVVMLSDEFPEHSGTPAPTPEKPTSVAVSILFDSADQVDAMFAQAVAAGANGWMKPEDMFWGDRFAMLDDPFGHRWMLNAPLQK